MQCPICGTKIEKGWTFCPRCGTRMSGDFFEEIFSRMRKELAEMNKLLEKDIEAFDLSPWFRNMERQNNLKSQPKGSGFSIKIIQSGGEKPKVSVRTFGDVDKEKLRKEMGEFGTWQNGGQGNEGVIEHVPRALSHKQDEHLNRQKVLIKESMRTEEPKTSVAKTASKVVVSLELPGVKSPEDIEVSELESSVEVKALAHDMAYFKILTKPRQFRLSRRSFQNGVLQMEFS